MTKENILPNDATSASVEKGKQAENDSKQIILEKLTFLEKELTLVKQELDQTTNSRKKTSWCVGLAKRYNF